jgi:hypothetical protein
MIVNGEDPDMSPKHQPESTQRRCPAIPTSVMSAERWACRLWIDAIASGG